MENEKIDKSKLFNYTFYDEDKKLCVVLNQEFIKQIFNADIVLLDEIGHK